MKTTYIRCIHESGERIDLYIAEDDPRTYMNVQFVNDGNGWEHVDSIPMSHASAAAAKAEMSRFADDLVRDGYTKQN